MTQFNPTNRMPRPRFTTTLPSGPSVGLQAAGIEDPVVGRDPAAEQLQGAISEFTRTVNIAGNIASRNAETEERAAARAERDAEKAAREAEHVKQIQRGAILRGIATDVRESLPGDIDAISKGDPRMLPTKEDQGDPELFLERLATERTASVPEEFQEQAKDHFKALWATRGLGALYNKRDTDQANALRVSMGGVTDELLLLDDPTKIADTLNRAYATIPGIKQEQLDKVAADAMFSYAKQGTPEARKMLEGFKTMLGNREVDQQERADRMLAEAEARVQVENNRNFADESATLRMQALDPERPASPESVKIGIEAAAKKYGIAPRVVEEQLSGVNAAIRRKQEADLEKTDLLAKEAITEKHLSSLDAAADSRTLFVAPELDTTTAAGTRVKMTKAEGIEIATQRAFARIEQGEQNPAVAFKKKALWAADNGVQPADWRSIMDAGHTASTAASVLQTKKDGSLDISPATIAGVDLYRRLKAVTPENLASMVPEKSRPFYEAVSLVMDMPEVGSPGAAETPAAAQQRLAQAVITANRAIADPRRRVSREVLETAAESYAGTSSGARNGGAVLDEISKYAEVYAALGRPPEEAASRAAKLVESKGVVLNDSYVDLSGVQLSPELKKALPEASAWLIDRYRANHSDTGLTNDDLTMQYDRRTGLWAITPKDSLIPAPSPDGERWVYFTNGDMDSVRIQLGQEKQKKEDEKTIGAQINRQLQQAGAKQPTERRDQRSIIKGTITKLENALVYNSDQVQVRSIVEQAGKANDILDAFDKIDRQYNKVKTTEQRQELDRQRASLINDFRAIFKPRKEKS